MSEKKKRGGFLRRIGGAFVDLGDKPADDSASEELDELAAEEEKRQATSSTPSAGVPPPVSQPRASPEEGSLIGADPATIYAKTGTVGDPKTDQMLVTYESLKPTTPPDQLGTVLKAMMDGIQADPAGIRETIGQRIAALNGTVADERSKTAQRANDRNAQLALGTDQQNAKIQQMRSEIAKLEADLAQLTDAVKAKNAEEQGAALAFETNVKNEIARLQGLASVLPAPPAPAAEAPKKK